MATANFHAGNISGARAASTSSLKLLKEVMDEATTSSRPHFSRSLQDALGVSVLLAVMDTGQVPPKTAFDTRISDDTFLLAVIFATRELERYAIGRASLARDVRSITICR